MKTSIEFRSRQKELWGIMCFHDYFKDNVCRQLEFVPTPETKQLMRNLYLILKPLDFGFVILKHEDKSPELFRSLPPKTKLSFFIKSKNIRFSNFTEIPFLNEEEVFYFSNLSEETAELPVIDDTEVFYYFRNLKVGEIEKKLLHLSQHTKVKIKPKKFFLNIDSVKAFEEVEEVSFDELNLTDPWGETHLKEEAPYKIPAGVMFQQEVRHRLDLRIKQLQREGLEKDEISKQVPEIQDKIIQMLAKRSQKSLPVDLRHVPSGKYTVGIGKKSEDIYVSEYASDRNFGVIDLYLTGPGEPPGNCLIEEALNQNGETGLCHVINFKARTTYWRYLFLNYNGSNVEAVEVRDEEDKVEFSKPRADVLEYVGKPTLIVESQVPIQLQELPKQEFWLKRSKKGLRSMKDMKLPTATAETIRPFRKDDDTFRVVSDIYVYL